MVDVKGLFLIMDHGGIIEKIVNYGVNIPLQRGSFLNILDTACHEKASRFGQAQKIIWVNYLSMRM